MTAPYRLYGAELSPYSLKVRSYLRYKRLAHEWIERTHARSDEFSRYAKVPLIPVLVGADESVLQDSTPALERLEQSTPDPSITPDDPALAFLSALIEDYADEWVNKAMFHYRWSYEADQTSAASRIVDAMLRDHDGEVDRSAIEAQVRERMIGRLGFVGSNAETGPVIEQSFRRMLALLEAHLTGRSFLFGGRPALADFGLAAQLQQLLSDPTAGAILRNDAPKVAAYAERMQAPDSDGDFETLEALRPTLTPFLEEEVAGRYLAWAEANAQAMRADEGTLSVELHGRLFQQTPQRYAAKAFGEIRRKRALLAESPVLAALLMETGCDLRLAPPTAPAPSGQDMSDDNQSQDDDGAEAGAETGGGISARDEPIEDLSSPPPLAADIDAP